MKCQGELWGTKPPLGYPLKRQNIKETYPKVRVFIAEDRGQQYFLERVIIVILGIYYKISYPDKLNLSDSH